MLSRADRKIRTSARSGLPLPVGIRVVRGKSHSSLFREAACIFNAQDWLHRHPQPLRKAFSELPGASGTDQALYLPTSNELLVE